MTKFKAVLLDFDDTLVDTYMARLKAAEKAAEGVLDPGLDMDSIMKNWAGRPQREIWLDLAGDDHKADDLMEGYTNRYWNETNKDIKIFPGVRDLLDELKGKEVFFYARSWNPPQPVNGVEPIADRLIADQIETDPPEGESTSDSDSST